MSSSSTSLVAILNSNLKKLELSLIPKPNAIPIQNLEKLILRHSGKQHSSYQFLYLFIPLVLVRYLSMCLNSSLLILWGDTFLTKLS